MITPYLHFNGDCEDAFRFYEKVFGGKIQHLSRYCDIPVNPHSPMSEEQRTKVMHTEVTLTETGGLSGADSFSPFLHGTAVDIHAHMPSEEQAQKVFAALSEGGTVLSVLAPNPPPDEAIVSGALKDKYGFTWILSAMRWQYV